MKLIDADALANYANNQIVGITANDIMRFPTVDAEPVKHGQWINDGTCFRGCSECGCRFHFLNKSAIYRWCPNCGARMKGDTNEEP